MQVPEDLKELNDVGVPGEPLHDGYLHEVCNAVLLQRATRCFAKGVATQTHMHGLHVSRHDLGEVQIAYLVGLDTASPSRVKGDT